MIFTELIVFISAFVVLSYAGSLLVRSLTHMSKLLGLSEYLVAFVLMSIATSVPELFIGLSSSLQNTPSISLGNVLGTNLINLTLIIGVVAVFSKGITIESKISHQNFLLIFFIAFLPILLATDGVISRGDGLLLLLFFSLYIFRLLSEKEYFKKRFNEITFDPASILSVFKHARTFLWGVALLILSSFAIIWSSKGIAEGLDVSLLFFGIIFVALGTALPELIFGIKASFMKHPSMMLGNSLGSIAFNATFIVGSVALLSPIRVDFDNGLFLISAFLFISFLMFNVFSYSRSKISRREGIVLLLLYVAFLLFGFLS
ncbi:MAG: calcium/sodium antiporter [Patescibacteria group bacterium]|nr:MAG: calcium/sodium antiporter [Patescibacteria group bacterium]